MIKYSNDTVEIFKTFSDLIKEILKDCGLFIIYPDEQNKPKTKSIKYYNPELFTKDLFELTIFQEFGFKPMEYRKARDFRTIYKKREN